MPINPGLAFTGAEITTNGSTATRHLDAYQAAVFVQAWIGTAISGKVTHERPPANAKVSRVNVTGSWNGVGDLSTRTIYYASDGVHAWIAADPAGNASPDFWVAPARTIEAFAGTAKLIPTLGTESETSTSTTTAAPAADGDGDSSVGGRGSRRRRGRRGGARRRRPRGPPPPSAARRAGDAE